MALHAKAKEIWSAWFEEWLERSPMARGEFTAPHALGEHVGSLEKIDRR